MLAKLRAETMTKDLMWLVGIGAVVGILAWFMQARRHRWHGDGHGVLTYSMPRLLHPRPMKAFDPSRPARLHEQLNDRIDDWQPVARETWCRRMKWHDPAATVMDWEGLLYDGWEPIGPLQ
jgi:hypothetical protein